MSEKTWFEPNLDCMSTSRQGEIRFNRDQLVEILGAPHFTNDEGKVSMEWVFSTPEGAATLYDYKQRSSDCPEWSIGGRYKSVVPHVKAFIRERQKAHALRSQQKEK